jgi:hypothetical protein
MNLLQILENHVGNIELWPSHIVTYLFHHHPSPVQSTKLKEGIDFFYGNDVPQQMAFQFYNGCNGRASRFVLEQFHSWYHTWNKLRCRPHLPVYWNTRLRAYLYINGSVMNQSEPALNGLPTPMFGIDNTPFPSRIRDKLEIVKQLT